MSVTMTRRGEPVEAAEPIDAARRPLGRSMLRGAMGRCPRCGEGKLFAGFLKVAPACSACGEEFHHHRADDAPPYVTIMIVGHVVVPMLLWLERTHEPDLWIHFLLWPTLSIILSLLVLPPVKGAIVALQWANRMHGFDPTSAEADEDRRLAGARAP